MFFSIIAPVYNVEKFLSQCIDSILGQTFEDFELILSDDGSTDNSPSICDEYAEKDKRIRVIHKPNGGSSDARNVGERSATGKYIIYVDSDDYYADDHFLEKVYQKAVDTDADVICYKFKKYFEDKNILSDCTFSCPDFDKMPSLAKRIEYLVKRDAFYCAAWAKAYKRSIAADNGIEFQKGLLGEDQDWYYNLLLNVSSVEFLDEAFLVYRQRSNSVTSSWKIKNLTDCIYIIEKWSSKINQSNLTADYKNALLGSLAKLYCNMLIAYTRLSDKNKKDYYPQIKKLSYLLEYNINPRVNKFYGLYKMCGFGLLMFALRVICKIK